MIVPISADTDTVHKVNNAITIVDGEKYLPKVPPYVETDDVQPEERRSKCEIIQETCK